MATPDAPHDASRRRDPSTASAISNATDDRDVTISAEIQADHDAVHVTLDVAPIADDALESYVGSNLFLVWDRNAPDQVRRLVNLPHDIDPASAIITIHNGVLDLTARRRVPPTAGTTQAHHPTPHPDQGDTL